MTFLLRFDNPQNASLASNLNDLLSGSNCKHPATCKSFWPINFRMFKKVSLLTWLLISCYFVKYTSDLSPWKLKKIIDQDVIFYYGYLPATFIYHDWTFRFPDKPGFTGIVWSIPTPEGGRYQKMTMGVAMLYAPFFGIAHLYTTITNGLADGYSMNYQIALIWAGVFYFILGLFFLRKILEQFIPDMAVSLVLITISLGTNLLNYATMDGALSHVYSFSLFAIALWVFLKWIKSPKALLTILLGLTLGLIVLIRPTNITFALFLLLFFYFKDKDIKKSWQFILGLKWRLLLLAGSALLIWLPQMLYWKMNTGHYIFYSYMGENFIFSRPQIINGLFSYNKGWLVYTPMMWLAILGFFLMRDRLKPWLWPSLVTMLISIYIIFSWWCWWYGGGFSARPLVEFYVIMSLPLGAFFAYIIQKKFFLKALTALVVLFFLWLNLFQTKQYNTSLLHYDSMSKEVYWAIWGKQNWPENYARMLKANDVEKTKKGESPFP